MVAYIIIFPGQIQFFIFVVLVMGLYVCIWETTKESQLDLQDASNWGKMQGYVWKLFFFFFPLLQKVNSKIKVPVKLRFESEKQCGKTDNLWCQVDFSYLCGPISVWILAMRSAVLCSTRLERWRQNISEVSQNSNKRLSCQMTLDKLHSSFQ